MYIKTMTRPQPPHPIPLPRATACGVGTGMTSKQQTATLLPKRGPRDIDDVSWAIGKFFFSVLILPHTTAVSNYSWGGNGCDFKTANGNAVTRNNDKGG